MKDVARDQQPKAGWFTTTQWTVVVNAAQADTPEAREALNRLCQVYWSPVFAFVRMKGSDVHTAEDLTQGFFAWLLNKGHLEKADRERGRFRSFLLTYLSNFLLNERARLNCKKRGGDRTILSLDEKTADGLGFEPSHTLTPERAFERQWALTLLGNVMDRVREECLNGSKAQLFQLVRGILSGDRDRFSYSEIAAQLNMTEGALRTAVSRLRNRHGQLLREEITRTVASPQDVDAEIQHLLGVLSD